MEANALVPKPVAPAIRILVMALRRALGRWGLIIALAALPVGYAVHDLVSGYPAFMHGHKGVAPEGAGHGHQTPVSMSSELWSYEVADLS